MRVIDAHHHLWALDTTGHEWPTPAEGEIYRDFTMGDLVSAAGETELAATVAVQSQPTDADTDWLLATAAQDSRIHAVVGWVDLSSPHAADRIVSLASAPKLRGLRPMLQSIDDTDWLLNTALPSSIEAMLHCGLRFDALVQPRHLPMMARFMDRWPDLPVVIDHAAKPFIDRGVMDPWRAEIADLAKRGAWCKLSGLRTEQARGAPPEQLGPYVDHLVACFGDRLMWGSDWPVLCLSGDDFPQWLESADQLTALQGPSRERLFHGAAAEFYRLEV